MKKSKANDTAECLAAYWTVESQLPVEQDVLNAAQDFTNFLAMTDRNLRRAGATIPAWEVQQQVADGFWNVFRIAEDYQREHSNSDLSLLKKQFRLILMPWLCRSQYFWRSIIKPHGYSGDYRMIEWMYDLELGTGNDPTQPAIVNCLDYTFSTIHSVRCLWERRRWFAQLLKQEFERKENLQILDIACGGARYIRDFMSNAHAPHVSITLLDQDAAAIAFARDESLAPWRSQVKAISAPIKDIAPILPSGSFDVVVSAGLFDYLDQPTASMLIRHSLSIMNHDGVLAVSNFHPDDPSACCKDWGANWHIVFRDEQLLADLFPKGLPVHVTRSSNQALAYACARHPASAGITAAPDQ